MCVHVLAAVVHVARAVGAHEALVARPVAHHHALPAEDEDQSSRDKISQLNHCTIQKSNSGRTEAGFLVVSNVTRIFSSSL